MNNVNFTQLLGNTSYGEQADCLAAMLDKRIKTDADFDNLPVKLPQNICGGGVDLYKLAAELRPLVYPDKVPSADSSQPVAEERDEAEPERQSGQPEGAEGGFVGLTADQPPSITDMPTGTSVTDSFSKRGRGK